MYLRMQCRVVVLVILFTTFAEAARFRAEDCQDVYNSGKRNDGVYTINPGGTGQRQVYCDMTTDGGGWTVIQRRENGVVHFDRLLHEYHVGFGDLTTYQGEFWLGNKNISIINMANNKVYGGSWYFKLVRFNDEEFYRKYDQVWSDADDNEIFIVYPWDTGSGSAPDSFVPHDKALFMTTLDVDYDNDPNFNCGQRYKGGWFFDRCTDYGAENGFYSNLNGHYWPYSYVDAGVYWDGLDYSLKASTIMIRPFKRVE